MSANRRKPSLESPSVAHAGKVGFHLIAADVSLGHVVCGARAVGYQCCVDRLRSHLNAGPITLSD